MISTLIVVLLTCVTKSLARDSYTTCPPSDGAPGGIYICPHPNFQGPGCFWRAPSSECYRFGRPYFDRPKSLGPDPGGYCEFFMSDDCTGEPSFVQGFADGYQGDLK